MALMREDDMNAKYSKDVTGLLLIDPYNDFIAEQGKMWSYVKAVAEEVGTLSNMKQIVAASRRKGIQIFVVPHHRWEQGSYANWKHINPWQLGSDSSQIFAKGTWGGEFHPDFTPQASDVIIKEHWASSGFANTDLDFHLKQRGIAQVIVIGLLANTCLESTSRYAVELGYHVTLVKDATAAFSKEAMHAAHGINGPTFAHALLTTKELLGSMEGE